MAKKSKKITFSFGKDANEMLERKLVKNFIVYGKLTSTEKKIKFLKKIIEKIVINAKKNTQATRNQISKKIADKKVEALLFEYIVPALKEKKTGFVRAVKLNIRQSDGSKISRLEWTLPVVIEKKQEVKEKKPVKKAIKKKTVKKGTDKKVKSVK